MSNEPNKLLSSLGRKAGNECAAKPHGQFLVYPSEDGRVKIDIRLEGETAWLTQAHMAALFQTTVPNVSMHLRNVYAEGELQAAATILESTIANKGMEILEA